MNSVDTVQTTISSSNPDNTISLDISYDATLTSDISRFEGSLEKASLQGETAESSVIAKTVLDSLAGMNTEAAELAEFANSAVASGDGMTPSDIISLTVKSQEFMFHSQLTANIANRTADGIQQLFRQQG